MGLPHAPNAFASLMEMDAVDLRRVKLFGYLYNCHNDIIILTSDSLEHGKKFRNVFLK